MLYAYCMEEAFSHPRVGGGTHEVGGGLRNTLASAYVQSEIPIL